MTVSTQIDNPSQDTPLWKEYLEQCKPKVVLLILFTALVGMFLSTDGWIPFNAWFFGLLGIGLAASAGAALNHWVLSLIHI